MCFLHDKNKPSKGRQVGLNFEDSNPSSSEDSDDNEIQTCELTRSANESMHELDANVSYVQIENQEQEIWEQNIEQQGSSVSDVLNSPETDPFKTPNTKEGTKNDHLNSIYYQLRKLLRRVPN
ncbi:unnamed protein product [Acanthoscelides obtectus]|uniref:Uncharacterized protein n=1 Tax=Acanthoscelides obtectus TaxID=200917 RepID=A0A9P0PYY5_ACAOB|nr:unnamed protein product [Acanthoscelides obtectus]CAK1683306.1 hypothetical protein AOBTE_LOCUS34194 [Acanthoscelides obtectus]